MRASEPDSIYIISKLAGPSSSVELPPSTRPPVLHRSLQDAMATLKSSMPIATDLFGSSVAVLLSAKQNCVLPVAPAYTNVAVTRLYPLGPFPVMGTGAAAWAPSERVAEATNVAPQPPVAPAPYRHRWLA